MKFLVQKLRTVILLGAILLATNAYAEAQLIMVEEQGCIWCARWNAEIGPIYPKTEVGKASPLRRIDINQPTPDGMTFVRPLRFTPTFVLLIDGIEKGRIEGYPGEEFFWSLIEQLAVENNVLTLPAT